MPLYTKRPITIEARQWDGSPESAHEIVEWTKHGSRTSAATFHDSYLRLQTLEGVMIAHPGDYIIKGIQREFYPCKPDIFIDTYEETAA